MIKRKSINRTILAVGTAAVLVGGTLAWFTSEDKVINSFKTGGNGTNQDTDGVEIWEKFDNELALKTLPGTIIDKEVQAQNTATYDSLIRVMLTPKIITTVVEVKPDINKINLILDDNASTTWMLGEDGYYYYLGNVAPNGYTTTLLKDVQLNPTAGNEFKDIEFDVEVDAESIQTDNNAYKDAWKSAGEAVLAELAEVVKKSAEAGQVIPGAEK